MIHLKNGKLTRITVDERHSFKGKDILPFSAINICCPYKEVKIKNSNTKVYIFFLDQPAAGGGGGPDLARGVDPLRYCHHRDGGGHIGISRVLLSSFYFLSVRGASSKANTAGLDCRQEHSGE